MKTKLDYYRVFYETARFRSFSTAAQHLYISQSAISQCIQQLESDLKVQLFIRTKRGISLTNEGKILYLKVENAINSIEQGESQLERLRHLESGELRIAAGDTITTHFLLKYLEDFHATYPDIRIEMANSYSSQMLTLVKEGKADLAFVNMPMEDEELIFEECLKINDVFICGPDFENESSYSWEDVAKLPLILIEKNASSRHFLEKNFKERSIRLDPQIEVAVHDLLIRFASIHLGISCVIEQFSQDELEKGIIKKLPLDPPLPARSIGCAYLKNAPLSYAAKAFMDLIKNTL
ncbi:MAG: LysR family transcriptional regulator [Clostridia bacterium]|nr:LysR family transcriptional regulator [Clostridia bacterium]MBQ9750944.1 LysR family transcriptional regulator [Clostridia bacterium]